VGIVVANYFLTTALIYEWNGGDTNRGKYKMKSRGIKGLRVLMSNKESIKNMFISAFPLFHAIDYCHPIDYYSLLFEKYHWH